MRRAVIATASAVLVVLLGASAAEAKGAASLTISGPGLAAPVELRAVADGPSLSWQQLLHLTAAARMYSQLNSMEEARVDPPSADALGPRYLARYELHEPGGTFVQHLYPFARPRAVAYAPAQATSTGQTSEASWIEVSEYIAPLLMGVGVPRPAPGLSRDAPPEDSALPSLLFAAAFGLAATTTGLLVRRRVAHHPRPSPA